MYNPSVHPTQTNTRQGQFVCPAGQDLSDLAPVLIKLTESGGRAVASLPTSATDPAEYLLLEGAPEGGNCTVTPLSRERNQRVKLVGAASAGEELVLAPFSGEGAIPGAVQSIENAAAGDHSVILRAEETGTDGQHILSRPILQQRIETIS